MQLLLLMSKELLLGTVMGIQGYFDWKRREIPLSVSVIGGVAGIIFCICEHRRINEIMVASAFGIVMLVFAKITNQVIGYGDGVTMLMLGLFLPVESLLSMSLLAFGLAGAYALILLVVFHGKRNTQIPFIPFLTIANGIRCFTEVML